LECLPLRLRDGRRLAYAEHGDPHGAPLVFLHGYTASRLTRHPDDSIAATAGIRLITVDRPGCGASDLQPRRTLLDWPADLAQLADTLGLERFAVLGHSAGGPYALACARALPDRISATGVVSGFAPFDGPRATDGMRPDMARFIGLLRRVPWLARPITASLPRQYARDPDRAFARQFGKGLPPSDERELAREEIRANILASAVESTRGGGRGLARELQITFALSWGFTPAEVTVPVALHYGDADPLTPRHMGARLHAELPRSTLTVHPGEGHMVYITHWREILRGLTCRSG
jgi:pimeloyl-ACP methyl ester carboxylesterase